MHGLTNLKITCFCCEIGCKIMSFICGQTIRVPKSNNVKSYYQNHLSKYDQYTEQLQEDKLRDFKSAPN